MHFLIPVMGFISAGLFGVYSGSAYLDVISQSHSGSQVRSIDTSTDSKGSTYDAGHFIISPRGQGFLIRSAPVAIYVALANTMYATGLPQRMTDLTLSSVQKIGFNARTKNFVARCLPYSSEAYSFLKFYGRSILSVAKEGAMRNRITGELPRDFIERTFPEIAAAFDVSKLTAAQPLANFAEEYTGSFPQNTLVGVVVTPFAFACRVISEPDVCRVESEIWEFLSRDDYDLSEKSNWEVLKDMSGVIGSAIGHALGQAFGEGYRWGRDLSSMLLQSYSVNLFMLIVSFLPVCRGTIRPVLIRVFRDGAVAMRKLRSKCNHHLRRRYNVPQIIQGDLSRLRPQRKVENDNQGQKHREGTAPFLETREEGFIEETSLSFDMNNVEERDVGYPPDSTIQYGYGEENESDDNYEDFWYSDVQTKLMDTEFVGAESKREGHTNSFELDEEMNAGFTEEDTDEQNPYMKPANVLLGIKYGADQSGRRPFADSFSFDSGDVEGRGLIGTSPVGSKDDKEDSANTTPYGVGEARRDLAIRPGFSGAARGHSMEPPITAPEGGSAKGWGSSTWFPAVPTLPEAVGRKRRPRYVGPVLFYHETGAYICNRDL